MAKVIESEGIRRSTCH